VSSSGDKSRGADANRCGIRRPPRRHIGEILSAVVAESSDGAQLEGLPHGQSGTRRNNLYGGQSGTPAGSRRRRTFECHKNSGPRQGGIGPAEGSGTTYGRSRESYRLVLAEAGRRRLHTCEIGPRGVISEMVACCDEYEVVCSRCQRGARRFGQAGPITDGSDINRIGGRCPGNFIDKDVEEGGTSNGDCYLVWPTVHIRGIENLRANLFRAR